MMRSKPSILLENGLDLRKTLTTGSILHINEDYVLENNQYEPEKLDRIPMKSVDSFGKPVASFKELEKQMVCMNPTGFVKKKVLVKGGGMPLHKGCTVYVAFYGYWENEPEPFEVVQVDKPMVADLNDNGLLPGLQMAIESMLVEEVSVFLLAYQVMYGVLGIPPRIKPKAECVFYIKLLKSTLTPEIGHLDLELSEFDRVYHEAKKLYASGVTLHKTKNSMAAIQLFRKAVYMLHKCRLANEDEEAKQEKMLKKLYTNLAVCYNIVKQPLKTCVSCNEMNRLNSLWNNGKVLFQNAKALRMIGDFAGAEKRIKRAIQLCPNKEEIEAELELLLNLRESCNKSKLVMAKDIGSATDIASEDFKREVDNLIKNFKENVDLCKLTLPSELNNAEIDYVKEACIRDNLFFNRIQKDYALDKTEGKSEGEEQDN